MTLARGGADGLGALASPSLPDGNHALEVRAAGGAPASFIVEREPPQPWLWPLLVALPTLLLAAWGAACAEHILRTAMGR